MESTLTTHDRTFYFEFSGRAEHEFDAYDSWSCNEIKFEAFGEIDAFGEDVATQFASLPDEIKESILQHCAEIIVDFATGE